MDLSQVLLNLRHWWMECTVQEQLYATNILYRVIHAVFRVLWKTFQASNITLGSWVKHAQGSDDIDVESWPCHPQKIGCRVGNSCHGVRMCSKAKLREDVAQPPTSHMCLKSANFPAGWVRQPPWLAASCSKEILKGLDHMHRNGIFHRDVKPENLLLLDDEAQWLLLGNRIWSLLEMQANLMSVMFSWIWLIWLTDKDWSPDVSKLGGCF